MEREMTSTGINQQSFLPERGTFLHSIGACQPRSGILFEEVNRMSKRIPLTKGQFAIVDDEDYKQLSQWKWYAQWNKYTRSFYAIRASKRENGKWHIIPMAREILGLTYGDKRQGDHINHNTLNNRKSNLRIVTLQQNHWNRKSAKGYYWNKSAKKYQAYIRLNGKRIHLGQFHIAEEAHNAYLEAKKHYHNIQTEVRQ